MSTKCLLLSWTALPQGVGVVRAACQACAPACMAWTWPAKPVGVTCPRDAQVRPNSQGVPGGEWILACSPPRSKAYNSFPADRMPRAPGPCLSQQRTWGLLMGHPSKPHCCPPSAPDSPGREAEDLPPGLPTSPWREEHAKGSPTGQHRYPPSPRTLLGAPRREESPEGCPSYSLGGPRGCRAHGDPLATWSSGDRCLLL